RDGDGAAERGLGHRHVHLGDQVTTVALEPLVWGKAHLDVEVAGRRALTAGLARPRDAQPVALVDAGRDVDAQGATLGATTLAAAAGAGVGDLPAAAVAGRTRRGGRQLPERGPYHALDLAITAAGRAGRGRFARRR